MKTGVQIGFTNTATGVAQSADGVPILFVQAVAVSSTFNLNQVYKLTQLSDLDTLLGDSATYDATNEVSLVRQVTEFYSAADNGTILYLVGVDKSSTMSEFVASEEFETLLRSTGVTAEGNPSPNSRAKMIGVVFAPQDTPTSEGTYYSDVLTTATALETALDSMWDNGFRAFAVLDGNNLKSVTDAPDFNTQACPRVAIHDTTATKDSCASIGLVLGILSQQAVNYDLGNVSAGSLPIINAWFTDGTPVSSILPAQFETLGMNQHLFIRTRDTKSGYFFNDGATADSSTMALSSISANRVLNKIADYLQEYLTNIIGSTPPVGTDGNVDSGYLTSLEESFYTTYTDPMVTNGEVSQVQVSITNVGVFTSTRTLNAEVSILPRNAVAWITANIQFVTSL